MMKEWCVGQLKVRGKRKDIQKFLLEGLETIQPDKDPYESITCDDCYFEITSEKIFYIKNTYKGYVKGLNVYMGAEPEDKQSIVLNTGFAWEIDADELLTICEKYKLDMKIYGFQKTMYFNQLIEIVNNVIVSDDKLVFDDYNWDSVVAAPEDFGEIEEGSEGRSVILDLLNSSNLGRKWGSTKGFYFKDEVRKLIRENSEYKRNYEIMKKAYCSGHEWIPVGNETDPKEDGNYIVKCTDEKFPVRKASYIGGKWQLVGREEFEITAWMPNIIEF